MALHYGNKKVAVIPIVICDDLDVDVVTEGWDGNSSEVESVTISYVAVVLQISGTSIELLSPLLISSSSAQAIDKEIMLLTIGKNQMNTILLQ